MIKVINDGGRPWVVRLVFSGMAYGLDFKLTHDKEKPLVEFYDARFEHTPYGQFVSRYYAETLLEGYEKGRTAGALIERASTVTRVLRPFLTGPFTAMVIPVGKVLGELTADRQFSRTELKEWSHKGILDALDADGWVSREFFEQLTDLEVDRQGNRLHYFETLRMDCNVATVRCNSTDGYLMIVRVPEGEGEY